MIPLLLSECKTKLITLNMLFKCMHNYLQSNVFQVTSYSLSLDELKGEKLILA